jgi:hypothetical protein
MPQEKRATPQKVACLERHRFRVEGFEGESVRRTVIDASGETVYIHNVPVKKVQVGQVWKKNDTGESFLVTKMYNEALTSFAVLRKTGSESEAPMRVKVAHTGGTADLPGFSYTQQTDDF